MRLKGKRQPLFLMAARTRSFASFTAVSGSPTKLKAARPLARSTSTSTIAPSKPMTAQLRAFDNMSHVPPSTILLHALCTNGGKNTRCLMRLFDFNTQESRYKRRNRQCSQDARYTTAYYRELRTNYTR